MNQTLIADSGSTKTDWAFAGRILKTQGINPVLQDDAVILAILRNELLPQLSPSALRPQPSTIRFYGSGVRPEQEARLEGLLREVFPMAATIEARSDLLGAARALCGGSEGIACILGTGANSCLFDGQFIVMNTPAMGYILGDEGGGAVLGKLFLNAIYKNRLPKSIKESFETEMHASLADVIDHVYRQPMANRWLASLSPFIHSQLCEPAIHEMVVENFRQFICRNVVPYNRPDLPVSAVGSIAFHYKDQLAEAVMAEGYALGRILKSPISGLMGQL